MTNPRKGSETVSQITFRYAGYVALLHNKGRTKNCAAFPLAFAPHSSWQRQQNGLVPIEMAQAQVVYQGW